MELKLLPFIFSALWEILSPVVSKARKVQIGKELMDFSTSEDRKTCEDLIDFSNDMSHLTFGLLTSLVSFAVITYYEVAPRFWIIIFFIILGLVLGGIFGSFTVRPYKWVNKKWLYWGRQTALSLILNIMFIFLIIYIPEIKDAIPFLFNP